MLCTFYLNGIKIGNEAQLTDYILTKKEFHSKYGDAVFEMSTRFIKNDKLLEKLHKQGEKDMQSLHDWVKSHGILYDEDGAVMKVNKPAIGVNRYISCYEDIVTGKHIQPEFRLESYWNRKKEMWEALDFTEDEKELISEIEGNPNFDFTQKPSKELMEKWSNIIQEKWTAQGRTGTVIHAISELYFGQHKDVDGNLHYNFELIDKDPTVIEQWFYNKTPNSEDGFIKHHDEYNTITFGDYVSDIKHFKKMIEMCSQLRKDIQNKYGKNCKFFPEFTVSAQAAQKVDDCDTLVGIIDLLVLDEDGRTHIYDYKTSPKPYHKYNSTKKLGFTYQLAVYDRILQKFGIYTGDGTCHIIPIQLKGFKKAGDKYIFDDLVYSIETLKNAPVQLVNLSQTIKTDVKIIDKINQFLPVSIELDPVSDKLLEKVLKAERLWTPTYNIQKNSTDDEINKMLEERGSYTPNKLGMLSFTFPYSTKPITVPADSPNAKLELHKKVKEEILSWQYKKRVLVESFVLQFQEAINNPQVGFHFDKAFNVKGNSLFMTLLMDPYIHGDYEVHTEPAAAQLGMIYLTHKHTGNVTVLKLTGSILDKLINFGRNRTNLNGKFATDIEESSKGDSYMLKSYIGNLEALEAMHVLQNTDFGRSINITEIKVINPFLQKAMPVSNKELLYSYKNLMNHCDVLEDSENKFISDGTNPPKIAFLTEVHKVKERFDHIMLSENYKNIENNDLKLTEAFYEEIIPEINAIEELNLNWDSEVDKDKKLRELNKLRIKLENTFSGQLHKVARDLVSLNRPEYLLYYAVMLAINELKNINPKLQVTDASNFWGKSIKKLFTEGWEGLLLENPGNFKSPMLNNLTSIISTVYQNLREKLLRENKTIKKLVEDIKKEANYGWGENNVYGNDTKLFLDMTMTNDDGDFVFVNPNTLQGAKKRFLEYALDVINKNRFPDTSEEELELWKETYDLRYYQVPLLKASEGSEKAVENLLQHGKNSLKKFKPAEIIRDVREKAEGFFIEEDEELKLFEEDIYKMHNLFRQTSDDRRATILQLKKLEHPDNPMIDFEHNVERILIHHIYSYQMEKQMGDAMPSIKATAMCLAMQGAGGNVENGNFNKILDFIEKYVKHAINKENINESDALKDISAVTGKVARIASLFALALSPLQFTYLKLEGVFKNCALILKKPDGTMAFSWKNMLISWKDCEKEMFNYSDKKSKLELINELFGINDMDANQFAERISSDHSIWTHFTDFLFRFASRPDFYNRMTIFTAQMREHGTFDAYSVDSEGNLKYDWKLDKRFDAYAKKDKSNPRYQECYANYIAQMLQFIDEGVTIIDPNTGEERLIQFGDEFQRAYTNKEAQSMKAIADNMYGYYNHETKSMLSAHCLGGLAMQMKTYWSAKKNLYLGTSGVKLVGHWEDYKENGKQLYYLTGENGEIDLSLGFTDNPDAPNCSKVKVKKWKGQWQEGVVATLCKFGQALWTKEENQSYLDVWNGFFGDGNLDENLKIAYRSNLKHLLFDLFMMFGFGNLMLMAMLPEDEYLRKEHFKNKESMEKAVLFASYHFLYDTVRHSFMDFNFIDSIFSPIVDWQPFAFSSMTKLAGGIWKYATSDTSFNETVANSTSIGRQIKPIIRTLTYE